MPSRRARLLSSEAFRLVIERGLPACWATSWFHRSKARDVFSTQAEIVTILRQVISAGSHSALSIQSHTPAVSTGLECRHRLWSSGMGWGPGSQWDRAPAGDWLSVVLAACSTRQMMPHAITIRLSVDIAMMLPARSKGLRSGAWCDGQPRRYSARFGSGLGINTMIQRHRAFAIGARPDTSTPVRSCSASDIPFAK